MGEIYKITNKINNNSYIGQVLKISSTGRKLGYKNRFKRHIQNAERNYKGGCPKLENAIRKYGRDKFKIELICECQENQLNFYEDLYINKFNTLHPNGYNLMSGGGNGRRHSKISREKMSKTRTGKKHKEITKERIGKAHKNKIVEEKSKRLMSLTKKQKNIDKYPNEIKEVIGELNLDTLPMYIYVIKNRIKIQDNKINYGFKVDIPNKKSKKFTSFKITIIEKLKMAIDYKDTIINGHRS